MPNFDDLFRKNFLNSIYGMPKPYDKPEEVKEPEPDEWVWVTGYKGTDADMKCQGYQYALGETFELKDGEKVSTCRSGFHFCLKLADVYKYYHIGKGHRFFEVSGLVKKKDYETCIINGGVVTFDNFHYTHMRDDKLAAKEIKFIRELTIDEIFYATKHKDWPEDLKKMAIKESVHYVESIEKEHTLIRLGYSEAFARYLISMGKYDAAYAAGTQEGLSMDMKCAMILMGSDD